MMGSYGMSWGVEGIKVGRMGGRSRDGYGQD